MPYNLLLLPLIGGFLFLHIAHYFRFGAQRLDGYRLLFQSALCGIALATIARLVTALFEHTVFGQFWEKFWLEFSPFPYSGTSALALMLGPVLAVLVNLFIAKEEARHLEVRRHGNSLLKLLDEAEHEKRMVSVTLDSRKWYVGWVAESPNLDPQELYFRLLPFISGYRDKDNLVVHRSVFYQDVLQDPAIDKEQFFVTLALKDVKIASFFNDDVYNEFFADEPANSA